ncbi:MAG: bifunctional phosphopantothenoylcysteine decarboxylase/phosphopantothenate--cysteine ligase CoaBC [bacterium]|nr:bifunctional phosphopantothenoylcysteine decarboxylase/phosphopantothenate--cysteine ligase CoaBC [bacterium]
MPTLLLGVSGGISAHRALDLTSRLRQRGWEVRVVMTEHATRFVTPLAFQALSHRPVRVDDYDGSPEGAFGHIDDARAADVVAIVPATANVLAKLSLGLGDDALTTTMLASRAPMLVAPAMNTVMWEHPTVQEHLTNLRRRGVEVVMPQAAGVLACGEVGAGKLATVDDLEAAVVRLFERTHDLAGRRILVTAGGTREALDPVRYLGNRSSGKMGQAIAREAARRGAQVTLVSTTPHPAAPGLEVVSVESALEMHAAVLERAATTDVVVMTAAVADYRPEQVSEQKRKKSDEPWGLTLVPNPDILAELGASRKPGQWIVGFAAETEHVLDHARAKLARKRADCIVANDVSLPGLGFGSDDNAVTMVFEDGTDLPLGPSSKDALARALWDAWLPRLPVVAAP